MAARKVQLTLTPAQARMVNAALAFYEAEDHERRAQLPVPRDGPHPLGRARRHGQGQGGTVNGHTPQLGRVRRGRKTYGRGGDQWGTSVRCTCLPDYRQQWHQQINEAASSGGTAEAMRRWWAHVAEHLAGLPGHRWAGLSLRLRRQFYCEGYTAKGAPCSAHASWRYGPDGTSATVVLCTTHARLAGCTK